MGLSERCSSVAGFGEEAVHLGRQPFASVLARWVRQMKQDIGELDFSKDQLLEFYSKNFAASVVLEFQTFALAFG